MAAVPVYDGGPATPFGNVPLTIVDRGTSHANLFHTIRPILRAEPLGDPANAGRGAHRCDRRWRQRCVAGAPRQAPRPHFSLSYAADPKSLSRRGDRQRGVFDGVATGLRVRRPI